MGLYLRAVQNFGPVRLTVSQAGIGVSVGVPGVRIGRDARGQFYLDAGLGPVRYRKVLRRTEEKKSSS